MISAIVTMMLFAHHYGAIPGKRTRAARLATAETATQAGTEAKTDGIVNRVNPRSRNSGARVYAAAIHADVQTARADIKPRAPSHPGIGHRP